MTTKWILSLLLVMLASCGKKAELTALTALTKSIESTEESVDSLDKYLMLEELSDEAIADIREAIHTADTLTDVFYFQGSWEDSINPKAFQLMERVMQRSFNYDGLYVYAHEWACQDTVASYFLDYMRQNIDSTVTMMDSVVFNRVLMDIDPILQRYGASVVQPDINSAAFIGMNMATLKSIGAYKDMTAMCKEQDLRRAYFMDYADWIDAFAAVNEHNQGDYSMYPLEINNYGEQMMNLRYDMLQQEMEQIRIGQTCIWPSEKFPIDWGKDDAELLRPWYDRRMAWVRAHQNHPQAENFRLMTEKIVYMLLNSISFGF